MFGRDAQNKLHVMADPTQCLTAGPGNLVTAVACASAVSWWFDWPYLHPATNSGLCLDDFNGKLVAGNTVGTWVCHNGTNQMWRQTSCFGTTTTTVTTSTSTTTTTTSTTTTSATPTPTGLVYQPLQLFSLPSLAQTLNGNSAAGAKIVMGFHSLRMVTNATQQFALDAAGKMHVQADPTLCFGATATEKGQTVYLAPCTSAQAIVWTIEAPYNDPNQQDSLVKNPLIGPFWHPNGNSALCLDCYNGILSSGNPIGLWPCHEHLRPWNQEWQFNATWAS
ncbi:hypothetical protein HDU83_008272 [Entophlyctis luteolus]|nr:hypothetical protein HDU83_008272 [Entophlyctis luteolus]